jgi:uncharacterized protein (DUF1330 family)
MTGEVKMKGYSIAVIDVHDQDKYMSEYLPTAVKLYEAAGGKALVRGGKTAGDHAPKGRVVVLEFPSLEAVEKLVASPEWLNIQAVGEKYSKVIAYAVEGV